MMCKLMQRLLVAETSGLSFPCTFFMWAHVLEGQPCQPFDGSNLAKEVFLGERRVNKYYRNLDMRADARDAAGEQTSSLWWQLAVALTCPC